MNKRLVLAIILLTILLDFFNLGLIYPLFSSLIFEGHGEIISQNASSFYKNAFFGVLIATFPLGQFLGAPMLGRLSDQHGRRKLLIFSLLGMVATSLFCALGISLSSLTILLTSRFLGGLMAGNLTLAYASLADFSTEENKVKNFALIPIAIGIGFALGPYVAGILANPETFSFSSPALPFLVAALFSLINLFLVIWKFPETTNVQAKSNEPKSFTTAITTLVKALGKKSLRPYLSVLFFMISANLLFCQFVGPFAIERFHINITEVGYLYANCGISVALGHIFLTRKLSSYFSPIQALKGSLSALAAFLALLCFSPNLLAVHILTIIIMLSCAVAYTNAMALVSNQGDKENQGEVMGAAVSIQSLAEFLPATLVGFVAFFHDSVSLAFASACALSSLIYLYSIIRETSGTKETI